MHTYIGAAQARKVCTVIICFYDMKKYHSAAVQFGQFSLNSAATTKHDF